MNDSAIFHLRFLFCSYSIAATSVVVAVSVVAAIIFFSNISGMIVCRYDRVSFEMYIQFHIKKSASD